jgi:ethanolamine utilization cobalamin adenosyltransferase
MSQPKGFTKAKQEEYLLEIRQGTRRGAAAEILGFKRMDVLKYIDETPKFRAQVEDAEKEATELVEEALFQAAVSGNVSAAKTWLEYQGRFPTKMPQLPAQRPIGPAPAPGGTPADGEDDPWAELDNVRPIKR